jgi:transposase-like protein
MEALWIRKYLIPTNDSWRVDETYIKIKVKWCYLYRAVESEGSTINFWISENRDKKSACSVISEIETLHMLRKNQAGKMTSLQEVRFIFKIMNV